VPDAASAVDDAEGLGGISLGPVGGDNRTRPSVRCRWVVGDTGEERDHLMR